MVFSICHVLREVCHDALGELETNELRIGLELPFGEWWLEECEYVE